MKPEADKKLLTFLKKYAKILKDGIRWEAIGYLYIKSGSEPAGCVRVCSEGSKETERGEVVATFYTKGMSCSMPISPRDRQLALLLVKANNFLLLEENDKKDDAESI